MVYDEIIQKCLQPLEIFICLLKIHLPKFSVVRKSSVLYEERPFLDTIFALLSYIDLDCFLLLFISLSGSTNSSSKIFFNRASLAEIGALSFTEVLVLVNLPSKPLLFVRPSSVKGGNHR